MPVSDRVMLLSSRRRGGQIAVRSDRGIELQFLGGFVRFLSVRLSEVEVHVGGWGAFRFKRFASFMGGMRRFLRLYSFGGG